MPEVQLNNVILLLQKVMMVMKTIVVAAQCAEEISNPEGNLFNFKDLNF